MAMKILSKWEYAPFEIEYAVKYEMIVGTSETSAAKTYENQIEMIVTMEIPKSQFKDENINKLVKWGKLPVTDKNYYRDLAIEVTLMDDFKRSIVFTHAHINTNIVVETQKIL